MKALKKDLQAFVKDLKALALKTEKVAKKLDKLEKVAAAKPKRGRGRPPLKPAAKKVVVRGPRGASAMDMVFGIISKTKKGVDTGKIKEKTGFNDKKIWNAINRLKNQGKIKSARKGVYVKI